MAGAPSAGASRLGYERLREVAPLIVLLFATAFAWPERPLARLDDPLTVQTWYALDLDPARPRWRNRRGRYLCATWSDGIAQRCVERQDDQTEVTTLFDVAGRTLAKITAHSANGPQRVAITRSFETDLDVSSWSAVELGEIRLRVPSDAVRSDQADHVLWTMGETELRASVWEAVPPSVTQASFLETFRADCGCLLQDRTVEHLDGKVAIRLRIDLPHPSRPRLGEIWVADIGERRVVLSFTAPTLSDPRKLEEAMAPGRAVAALLQLTDAP